MDFEGLVSLTIILSCHQHDVPTLLGLIPKQSLEHRTPKPWQVKEFPPPPSLTQLGMCGVFVFFWHLELFPFGSPSASSVEGLSLTG